MSDQRVDVILKHIEQAGREVNPVAPPLQVETDDRMVVEFALKVFDRLMPIVLAAVVAEFRSQQKKQE